MIRVEKTVPDSFLKIVMYGSKTFENLNGPRPYYVDKAVQVISITPVGTDRYGCPLLCYELKD